MPHTRGCPVSVRAEMETAAANDPLGWVDCDSPICNCNQTGSEKESIS